MENDEDQAIEWDRSMMIEVELSPRDNAFLMVKEILTRMGVANQSKKKLWQSCHILHKKGRYYIVHYKEMFGLNNSECNITTVDINRRNRIIALLEQWDMITVISDYPGLAKAQTFILPFSEKEHWELIPKYTIGLEQR